MIAGRDTYQEGLSCYRLGNTYEGIGEHDTAIQVGLTMLLQLYTQIIDDSVCAVSQAIFGALQVPQ